MPKRSSIASNFLWHIKWLQSISLKHLNLIQTLFGVEKDLKTLVRQVSTPIFDLFFVLSPRIIHFWLRIRPLDTKITFPSLSCGHVTMFWPTACEQKYWVQHPRNALHKKGHTFLFLFFLIAGWNVDVMVGA